MIKAMSKKLGIIVIVLLVLVLLAAVQLIIAQPRPSRAYLQNSLNIAHRGASGLAPENTLITFDKALELGADVLELDIHATKDGKVVVIHDETVDRTTNGTGIVKELTLADLKKLDAGYYFTLDGGETYPYRGQGITIPTLKEVFAEFPGCRINIEIKQSDPPIELEVLELIEEAGMINRTLVVSRHDEVIERFRALTDDIATGASENELRDFMVYLKLKAVPFYAPKADAFQVSEWHDEYHIVTQPFLKAAHSKNIKVHVWTVNEEDTMRRLLEMGVDGIITDYPGRLSKELEELIKC